MSSTQMSGCSSSPPVVTFLEVIWDFICASFFCFCVFFLNCPRLVTIFFLHSTSRDIDGKSSKDAKRDLLLRIGLTEGTKTVLLSQSRWFVFEQEELGCRYCLPCASSVLQTNLRSHSIEPIRSTFAWMSFSLSPFPNTSFSSMVPGSSLGFPNCTAAFPTSVVDHCGVILDLLVLFLLLCCSKIVLWLSYLGLLPSTHSNDDHIFHPPQASQWWNSGPSLASSMSPLPSFSAVTLTSSA